jgi:SAM-dependent methyltransferase
MARDYLEPLVIAMRGALRNSTAGALVRRGLQRFRRALDNGDGLYGASYYGGGGAGRSGYERYDRRASNADHAADLIARHFPVKRTLDVGCALGFLVEVLRERGFSAEGCDFSAYALRNLTRGARGHVTFADLAGKLPFSDKAFELVSAFETLEHLPPNLVPHALSEIRRVTGRYMIATIPSFGPNQNGQDGWFAGKVRADRLDHYRALGPEYEGPVPPEDLMRDVNDNPIEGHLTIASWSWWRKRFSDAGFASCDQLERTINADLEKMGFLGAWNFYVNEVRD